jgi:hypothetical protein
MHGEAKYRQKSRGKSMLILLVAHSTWLASSPPGLAAGCYLAAASWRLAFSLRLRCRMEARSKLASLQLRLASPLDGGSMDGWDKAGYIYHLRWPGWVARPESADGLRAKAWLQSRSDAGRQRRRDLPRSPSQAAHPRFLLDLLRRNRHLAPPANDSDRSSSAPARSTDHSRPAGRVSCSLRSPQPRPKGCRPTTAST